MNLSNQHLKIAIQKDGRLTETSTQLLHSLGLEFEAYKNRLFSPCRNFPADILFFRDNDIPEYVADGVADLGIVGLNLVEEKGASVTLLKALPFGYCRLVIAVPQESRTTPSLRSLIHQKRIATSYPHLLRHFLKKGRLRAHIVTVSGAVEITPSLDVADAICDLVSSGSTLETHHLKPVATVLESQSVLIANPRSLKTYPKKEWVQKFLVRLEAVTSARRKKYVMMNAQKKDLSRIQKILPALDSPTVVPLAKKGEIAIHTVIDEEVFWETVEELKRAGASGIVVSSVEKLIP